MVSMSKDVLSDSVKRFVDTSKGDLNAFLMTSLWIPKFEFHAVLLISGRVVHDFTLFTLQQSLRV